jgi:hypothetical protein
LFVSGTQGAPMRYRVLNQVEQLAITDLGYTALDALAPTLSHRNISYDMLYLYRVDDTPAIRRLIAQARSRGAPVVYDTDDLIWDQRIVEYCDLERTHGPDDVARFRAQVRRAEALMRAADVFVASTEYLAGMLRDTFGRPAFVNRNAVSRAMVAHSTPLFERRQQAAGDGVMIGYFSGWPKAHEPDLAVALPGLLRALDELPHARLRIVGHFDAGQLPEGMRGRVETAPFVPFEQLLDSIAQVDINLAPIISNPHRRAKSAVKVIEAALVGIPTVASDLEPYQLIRHGETGMLAGDAQGWYAAVLALGRSAELRRRMGAAARQQALREETTDARAPGFAALLRDIASFDYNQGHG